MSKSAQDYVIGIDLGTSTTEAAVFRDGKPLLLPNAEGERITPSVVGIDESGNWVVGERARAQLLLSPENTAMEVKRLMGTGRTVRLGKRGYTPVELSAKLLEYVRNYAAAALGQDITRAVISVPAYFDDIQRQETVMAGKLAGFTVERILNEPTAAAMSYGLEHLEEESHILVYDLGGGTFDVTLLEMFEGVLEVKASSGDNQLGGKDFDECLVNHMLRRFHRENGVDLKKDLRAMMRLKDEAVRCKLALSTRESYRVELPLLPGRDGATVSYEETVTRAAFEKMTRELMDRTHAPIDTVLSDAGLDRSRLDRVILVGGSTRMPMVAADIEAYLGIKPEAAVNPDYAVAEGAAIQAGIIEGSIAPEDSLVMTDVNPYTLGVLALSGLFEEVIEVLIPRNVTIPVTRTKRFSTVFPGQTSVDVRVYQGESRVPENDHFLGNFRLDGIPDNEEDTEDIDIAFSYDLNGMLAVKATVVTTGREAGVTIDVAKAGEEKKKERGRPASDEGWKKSPEAKRYRPVIRRAQRLLKDAEKLPERLAGDLKEALEDLTQLLEIGEPSDEYRETLKLLEQELLEQLEKADEAQRSAGS